MRKVARMLVGIMATFLGFLLIWTSPAYAVEIFVSSFTEGTIYKIDSETRVKTPIASGLSYPEDMVIDRDGILYIGGIFTGVKRFDTKTGTFLTTDVGTNVCGPEGPSLDAHGDLFVNTWRGPCAHSGIWKIAGRTATMAVQVVPPFSSWGEGTAFLKSGPFAGHLIAADSDGRIVRSAPPDFGDAIDLGVATFARRCSLAASSRVDEVVYVPVGHKRPSTPQSLR